VISLSINRLLVIADYTEHLESFVKRVLELGIEVVGYGEAFRRLLEKGYPIQPLFHAEEAAQADDKGTTLICSSDPFFDILFRMKTESQESTPFFDMIFADFPKLGRLSSLSDFSAVAEEETARKWPSSYPSCITLLRTVAKDFRSVATLVDEADFDWVISSLTECGDIPLQGRRQLSLKVFSEILKFDTQTYNRFSLLFADESRKHLSLEKAELLQYGANPHQEAFLATLSGEDHLLRHLRGVKKGNMTTRRMIDLYKGIRFVRELKEPAGVYIRHGNPLWVCMAPGESEYGALIRIIKDESVTGGVLVINHTLDRVRVELVRKLPVELVAFNQEIEPEASALRDSAIQSVYAFDLWKPSEWEYTYLDGCFIVQERDTEVRQDRFRKLKEELFDPSLERELVTAFQVSKLTRSDSVVLWAGSRTAGIGAGQMLRLDAFEIALSQAKRRGFVIKDTVFATDGAILDAELFARVLNSGVRGMVFPSVTKTNQQIAALMAESRVPILLSNHRHFT